jgi:transglutaminase-like putative cysteine protease
VDTEPAVAQVARELQLHRNLTPQEAMQRVATYFGTRFQYATYLTAAHARTTNETELARFLLHTRSGHCEYFATATTLLLRYAGVPTRYAVGYSVQEGKERNISCANGTPMPGRSSGMAGTGSISTPLRPRGTPSRRRIRHGFSP